MGGTAYSLDWLFKVLIVCILELILLIVRYTPTAPPLGGDDGALEIVDESCPTKLANADQITT